VAAGCRGYRSAFLERLEVCAKVGRVGHGGGYLFVVGEAPLVGVTRGGRTTECQAALGDLPVIGYERIVIGETGNARSLVAFSAEGWEGGHDRLVAVMGAVGRARPSWYLRGGAFVL
jgi:hypothetical protein